MNPLSTIVLFTPLEVPTIPQPIIQVENGIENWWYEDDRSEWVVVEDCWSNDELHHQWWAIEHSIRLTLETVLVSRLVSSDLDWTHNGFCIRIQGLQNEVLSQRQIYTDILMHNDIDEFPRSIQTLDRRHFSWVYNEVDIPRIRRQSRMWHYFWEGASLRTVYSSRVPLPLELLAVPSKQMSWPPKMN